MNWMFKRPAKILLSLGVIWVLYSACAEFYNIAWGTGVWLGQFSVKWALIFFLFVLFCILCMAVTIFIGWHPQKPEWIFIRLLTLRDRLGAGRWILAILPLVAPVYVYQYTSWGVVFDGPYLRIFVWTLSTVLLGWLLTRNRDQLLSWPGILTSLVLTSGTYNFFAQLSGVVSYPFALGWSEGNRLWDYSMLFGRHLYALPANQRVFVMLDIGRQFAGGIPFLIPGVTILQARLWVALMNIVPYLILGWLAYKLTGRRASLWLLAGVWAFTFVEQGPIHTPLLICAIIVALMWERPLGLAIPLVAVAGYFAEISRFTWLFAPGIWAVMLELNSAAVQNDRLNKKDWGRVISVGLAGILGGYLAPRFMPAIIRWAVSLIGGSSDTVINKLGGGISATSVGASVSAQPLLWDRLFPNPTYGPGILIGLLIAVLPLVVLLIYLVMSHRWYLTLRQRLVIVLALLGFLLVGLIVSVKIGGGADLHNMDMFIIGAMFTGAIAWRNGGHQWIDEIGASPAWIRLTLMALIIIPGYQPLMKLMPASIADDMNWVATLADIPPYGPPFDTLPSKSDTLKELETIRREVKRAAPSGDILFMDQRQLLTFGYIKDVTLIPDYDKKVLIDRAMSENAAYFEGFYKDLASHRFSLIITNPVNVRFKNDPDQFDQENNAWVKWVSRPLLCYYQPLDILKKVNVELLVPSKDPVDCSSSLP